MPILPNLDGVLFRWERVIPEFSLSHLLGRLESTDDKNLPACLINPFFSNVTGWIFFIRLLICQSVPCFITYSAYTKSRIFCHVNQRTSFILDTLLACISLSSGASPWLILAIIKSQFASPRRDATLSRLKILAWRVWEISLNSRRHDKKPRFSVTYVLLYIVRK